VKPPPSKGDPIRLLPPRPPGPISPLLEEPPIITVLVVFDEIVEISPLEAPDPIEE
jgi:hypothetical protein